MAEGKTITIVQKGKKEEDIQVVLNCHPFMGNQTCYIITPTVDGVEKDKLQMTVFGDYVDPAYVNVKPGAKLVLKGQAHYCAGECLDAGGRPVGCFKALEDNPGMARFDGMTTWSKTITTKTEVAVTWT